MTCRDLARADTDMGQTYNNRQMGTKHSPAEHFLIKLVQPSPAVTAYVTFQMKLRIFDISLLWHIMKADH